MPCTVFYSEMNKYKQISREFVQREEAYEKREKKTQTNKHIDTSYHDIRCATGSTYCAMNTCLAVYTIPIHLVLLCVVTACECNRVSCVMDERDFLAELSETSENI